jgi:hypothetical protein
MAKLTPEISQNIALLKQQLLDIVDEATAGELTLFERFGETSETMTPVNDLRDIAEQASTRFSQFANIQLRIAQSQPIASGDLLQFLNEKITNAQVRIPALERSVQEIKEDWSLL